MNAWPTIPESSSSSRARRGQEVRSGGLDHPHLWSVLVSLASESVQWDASSYKQRPLEAPGEDASSFTRAPRAVLSPRSGDVAAAGPSEARTRSAMRMLLASASNCEGRALPGARPLRAGRRLALPP